MDENQQKRPGLVRRMPLWGFALFTGVMFAVIVMLFAVIIGLQAHLAALAGGTVCCVVVPLVVCFDAVAEILMAIVEGFLTVVAAIVGAIAAILSVFS